MGRFLVDLCAWSAQKNQEEALDAFGLGQANDRAKQEKQN
jgi:hypothetical protein